MPARRNSRLVLFLLGPALLAASTGASTLRWTIAIDGATRNALVVPAGRSPNEQGSPMVFALHGRGGTAADLARRLKLEDAFPEAIIVYPEALRPDPPGAPRARPPAGRRGSKEARVDPEVKFFDALLDRISRSYRVDSDRVHILGGTDGPRGATLLWRERAARIASLCLLAATGDFAPRDAVPRSILIIAGQSDPASPLESQTRSLTSLFERFAADSSQARVVGPTRFAPTPSGTEIGVHLHPGGHELPPTALPVVIDFFRRHRASEAATGITR